MFPVETWALRFRVFWSSFRFRVWVQYLGYRTFRFRFRNYRAWDFGLVKVRLQVPFSVRGCQLQSRGAFKDIRVPVKVPSKVP